MKHYPGFIYPCYKAGGGQWHSVAVKAVSEPENCHGIGFILRADARFAHRSRAKVGDLMQWPLLIYPGAGAMQNL
jgi:hypothetical protein